MSFAPVVDAGGLDALRAAAARGEPRALEEAAMHFEALFIGMLLKSARSASLGEGLLDGGDTRQYLEMMDAQVAQDVARRGGFGFGRMLVEQLGGYAGMSAPSAGRMPAARAARPGAAPSGAAPGSTAEAAAKGSTPSAREQFVNALLPHAKQAAERLGVDPRLLVAQAALETGWGASIPRHADGRSTHNVFGMKAGASWRGEKAGAWTLEVVAGVPERRRAHFRAYASIAESFADYADVIEGLSRYADARRGAADPEAYARAVADAGYATDPEYADKWLAVYRSEPIVRAAVTELTPPAQERTPAADNDRMRAAPHESPHRAAGRAVQQDPSRYDGLTARMD